MKLVTVALTFLMISFAYGDRVDLKGKLAEEFDWDAYFASGDNSTATQRLQALGAVEVLKQRMDELCKEYRELMTKRGDLEAVKLFDTLQGNWLKFADSEVAFVGASWGEGSGRKAAAPRHQFIVYLRRLKELRDLKAQSLFLNE
jgi:uncharacterized protein YecT (DUF1311 family)